MPRFTEGTGIAIRSNDDGPSTEVPDRIRIKNRRMKYLELHPEYFGPQLELAGVAASAARLLDRRLVGLLTLFPIQIRYCMTGSSVDFKPPPSARQRAGRRATLGSSKPTSTAAKRSWTH